MSRENQILKEVGAQNDLLKTLVAQPLVGKHLAKFVKKMLLISLSDQGQNNKQI